MSRPLVSVICLCYNHAAFVEQALASVWQQTYSNLEVIVVDDASTDTSVSLIERAIGAHPATTFIKLARNAGNCRAFNEGLRHAHGKYVIDFATDDVLLPQRVERQVNFFEQLDSTYGVVFTDAAYIDPNGRVFRKHYQYLFAKNLLAHIPQGDVYRAVLSTYFIASPTMMIRKSVLDELNGYDEGLAYEDFDFWVRSSRRHLYALLDEVLTQVRRKHRSLSTGWYKRGDPQLHSTYLVCKKAQRLNRDEGDKQALLIRVRYELRQAVLSQNYHEASLFFGLLSELTTPTRVDKAVYRLSRMKVPLSSLRAVYHYLRY